MARHTLESLVMERNGIIHQLGNRAYATPEPSAGKREYFHEGEGQLMTAPEEMEREYRRKSVTYYDDFLGNKTNF